MYLWAAGVDLERRCRGAATAVRKYACLVLPVVSVSRPDVSATELAQHLQAIESLSAVTGREVAEVTDIYEVVLARLQQGAHVRTYLPLLASRRARETLDRPAAPLAHA